MERLLKDELKAELELEWFGAQFDDEVGGSTGEPVFKIREPDRHLCFLVIGNRAVLNADPMEIVVALETNGWIQMLMHRDRTKHDSLMVTMKDNHVIVLLHRYAI